MEITLEKIELVKDRTGVTYAEAKEALESADGSVVDAIIAIEETVNAGQKGRGFGKKGEALFDSLKKLIKKGNVARIQVKRDGELILNVPVNAGIVGAVIAPIASVIGVVAAFGFKCIIEVVKEDGTIIDVSDAVTDAMGSVAEKSSEIAEGVKEKSTEIYQKAQEKGSEIYSKGKEKAEDAVDKIRKDDEEFDFSECFAEEDEEVEIKVEDEQPDEAKEKKNK
ncbi:MAG: DUF4342 domain-containing protein [Bacillota bacterium]|nr:DUF4342 domain-containing protein [Bacillota bacterium]